MMTALGLGAPGLLTQDGYQRMAHALPDASFDEIPKIAINGSAGWEQGRWGQMAPLASRSNHIEQGIEQPPHVRRPRPASRFGRRDQRFEQTVLIIAQSLAAAEVSDQGALVRAPHQLPPRW